MTEFLAVTVNEYNVPAVRPVTVTEPLSNCVTVLVTLGPMVGFAVAV